VTYTKANVSLRKIHWIFSHAIAVTS